MTEKSNIVICPAMLFVLIALTVSSAATCSAATHISEPNTIQSSISWLEDDLGQPTDNNISSNNLIKRFMYVIVMVAALGIAAYYLSKKVLPKLSITQGKEIRVLETIQLGQNKTLHLVQVGEDRKILIGSTSQNINTLIELSEVSSNQVEINPVGK